MPDHFRLIICMFGHGNVDMDSSSDELSHTIGTTISRNEVALTPSSKTEEKSLLGVSLNYMPYPRAYTDEDLEEKWYLLRIRYNHEDECNDELVKSKIETFFPKHKVARKERKKIVFDERPVLPGIIFVHDSRKNIEGFMNGTSRMAQFVRYYRDKTKPKTDVGGKNPPLDIKDNVMESFIKVYTLHNENSLLYIGEEQNNVERGDHVLVTDGIFKGVEGRVTKIKRHRVVIVDIKGVVSITTAYIPKAFLKVIEP